MRQFQIPANLTEKTGSQLLIVSSSQPSTGCSRENARAGGLREPSLAGMGIQDATDSCAETGAENARIVDPPLTGGKSHLCSGESQEAFPGTVSGNVTTARGDVGQTSSAAPTISGP